MSRSGKFEGIQALRGISVIFTVFAHLPVTTAPFAMVGLRAPWLIGVAIFYGISGWIIAHVTNNDRASGIAPFLVKRFFRLVPVLLLSVMITMVAAILLVHSPIVDQFYPPPRQALQAGLSNLFFLSDLGTWIPLPSVYSLEGLWSVAVEVKFYCVYAILLVLPLGLRRAGLCILLALAFGLRCFLVLHGYAPALSHVFFVELFCLGALSYQFRPYLRYHPLATAVAWIWIIGFASLYPHGVGFLVGYLGLLVSIVYVVNWAAAVVSHYTTGYRQRLLVWVGERSYVLYVLHFQLLSIAGLIAQQYGVNFWSPALYNAILVAGLLAGIPVVELVHQTVEKWGIRVGHSLSKSMTSAAAVPAVVRGQP